MTNSTESKPKKTFIQKIKDAAWDTMLVACLLFIAAFLLHSDVLFWSGLLSDAVSFVLFGIALISDFATRSI